jgi:iron complex transport system permease protein
MEETVLNQYRGQVRRRRIFLGIILAGLVLLIAVGITLGSSRLSLAKVIAAFSGRADPVSARIIWYIRLPRVLAAVLAGMALGVSGAALQSILKNPLASPYTLGISQAAAFGAAFAIIILNAGSLQSSSTDAVLLNNPYLVSGTAFLWSLAATALILLIARWRGATPEIMVLTGVIVGALFNAAITGLEYIANDVQLAAVVFWTFGDLGRASWRDFGILAVVILPVTGYFIRNSWNYNALDTGDETAQSLGLNIARLRTRGMIAASLVTALVVSFFGIIGFVGLAAPHMVRRMIGNEGRFLLPGAALFGGLFLLAADTAARTVLAPVVLPVGILTSLLGGPFFLYLLIKGVGRR